MTIIGQLLAEYQSANKRFEKDDVQCNPDGSRKYDPRVDSKGGYTDRLTELDSSRPISSILSLFRKR